MQEDKYKLNVPASWLFKMAWRDSRKNYARLLLFSAAIVLGIAALVAVFSFGANLQRDIDRQARELTGADLIIDSRIAVSDQVRAMLDTLGDERARQVDFASMLYFTRSGAGRLVQVRALEGNFPFYGKMLSTPGTAAADFSKGRNALVDQTVMRQYNARPGDSIQLGRIKFRIAGSLDKAPDQNGLTATIAPAVYIPLKYLSESGLAAAGSRLHSSFFYRYQQPRELEQVLHRIQPVLKREGLETTTVERKKKDTGRAFQDLNRFMALSGFIALLLGCIGVGSAIQVYLKEKTAAISTLRCLGLNAAAAFSIYLIQLTFTGFIASLAGVTLGTALQFLFPLVLKDLLPADFTMQVSVGAIAQGLLTGVVTAVLFALPSLLDIRKISPLKAIRAVVESPGKRPDLWKLLVYVLITGFILVFAELQLQRWLQAAVFMGCLLAALLLLGILSAGLLRLMRKVVASRLPYTWRQGFSNLYRPGNQTLLLITCTGLCTAFIALLYFVQVMLISRVKLTTGPSQPDMALFDIQPDQKDSVAALLTAYRLPRLQLVPVVTMRLAEINGRNAAQLARADSLSGTGKPGQENEQREPADRAFKSEMRATYQAQPAAGDELTAGVWRGKLRNPGDTVYISVDERYAERIGLKIGDRLLWNIQGMPVLTVAGSFRRINWTRMQTNFRVIFPEGVLEEAPQFYVLMTRINNAAASAAFQRAMFRRFPNVSVIDLRLIIQTLDTVLGKIALMIRFMAGFTMVTGWIVLIAAIRNSKNQRLRELVLLRTIGAGSGKLLVITLAEYLFLGMAGAAAGMLIALAGSQALAVLMFDTVFLPPPGPSLLLFAVITGAVVITGLLNSRKALREPPLAVLRKDS